MNSKTVAIRAEKNTVHKKRDPMRLAGIWNDKKAAEFREIIKKTRKEDIHQTKLREKRLGLI